MSTEVSSPGEDVLGWVTETAIRAGFAGVVGSDQDLLPLLQQQQQDQEGEQHAHTQLDRRNSSGPVDEEEQQQHWNRLGMLLMVSTMAALGTLGNIFAIAAVMTEDHLKKKGHNTSTNQQAREAASDRDAMFKCPQWRDYYEHRLNH
ncbi:hypothetical protein E2C01_059857 [Portunus trituberculatus]|uniref:Uncharacterized protein n=1 Tax=Portunus trituberculatus TaxID=210409 RepID=A0A5B7H0P0_PORTR|nr:hypothetical protein [Portunus trituberculatus]